MWPRLNPTDRALVRSQRGPMASIPFHTPPVSAASRFDPQCFRVLLLRRLWCQLPLSSATCRCGQPLDSRGHHGGACATAGVLGRRGYPLESCAARICREAGARVSVNVRVQDLDLFPGPRADNRRLEVVADGLPLFHGAQLAVDTTMVSTVRADGAPRRQCAERGKGKIKHTGKGKGKKRSKQNNLSLLKQRQRCRILRKIRVLLENSCSFQVWTRGSWVGQSIPCHP